MKYSTDFLLTLAYLQGERTVQATTTAPRLQFVQSSLEEVYRAYKWPFATKTEALNVASGIASLPTTFDMQHGLDVYNDTGGVDQEWEYISNDDIPGFLAGDRKYWIESQTDGTYLLRTKELVDQAIVKFQCKAPVIGPSTATPFTDTMTVALGARRYVKASQDPNADISQDEALFQKRLTENIAAVQVSNPRRKMRSRGVANNYRLGGGYE